MHLLRLIHLVLGGVWVKQQQHPPFPLTPLIFLLFLFHKQQTINNKQITKKSILCISIFMSFFFFPSQQNILFYPQFSIFPASHILYNLLNSTYTQNFALYKTSHTHTPFFFLKNKKPLFHSHLLFTRVTYILYIVLEKKN